MAYSVNHPLADLPAEVRTRVRRNREEIGRTIESFPVGGVMLESVSQSPMQSDVCGWRFLFKVETGAADPAPAARRVQAVTATTFSTETTTASATESIRSEVG